MQRREQGWNSALMVFFLLESISGNIVSAGQTPILGMAQKVSGSDFRPNVKVLRRWERRKIACVSGTCLSKWKGIRVDNGLFT
ncbi:unnamed protein product [Brugia pahangi]|uniref:Secreted protein n=1 Tax=Brugia pahangi TaxID=6280 RepID=A0A0N4TYJ1_BRUPA|nr:unnamed protein product [Brugia pahangi]